MSCLVHFLPWYLTFLVDTKELAAGTAESPEISEQDNEYIFGIRLISMHRSRRFNQAAEVPPNTHATFELDGIFRNSSD
jgi:hypothetical protein